MALLFLCAGQQAFPEPPPDLFPRTGKQILTDLTNALATGSVSDERLVQDLITLAVLQVSIPAEILAEAKAREKLPEQLEPSLLAQAERLAQTALLEPLGSLKRLSELLLPSKSHAVSTLQRLYSLAAEAERALATRDDQSLKRLFESAQNPAERAIVQVRRKQALENEVKSAALEQRPEKALELLSELDPERLPPELVRIGVQSLQALVTRSQSGEKAIQWPLPTPRVDRLLLNLEGRDRSISPQILEIFSTEVLNRLKAGDIVGAQHFFSAVLKRRADPSRENDELRLRIALMAERERGWYFGVGRFEELRGSRYIGIGSKIRLLLKGYYGSGYLIFLGLSFFLALAIALLHSLQVKLRFPRLPSVLKVQLPKRERRMPGYAAPPNTPDEYSRLLAMFGLDDTATEAEIKSAYRQAIRDCHPDSTGSSDPEKMARFQELKMAFERIQEFRGLFFGGR